MKLNDLTITNETIQSIWWGLVAGVIGVTFLFTINSCQRHTDASSVQENQIITEQQHDCVSSGGSWIPLHYDGGTMKYMCITGTAKIKG